MRTKQKKTIIRTMHYFFLALVGLIMIFPLIWLLFASSKTNQEIFGSVKLLPATFSLDAFKTAWKGSGIYTYANFFWNTIKMVIPTVVLTIISSTLVAYGFARFHFKGRNLLLSILISTMMLPNSVIIIPRYMLFREMGLLDSYAPWILPAAFACYPFFIYQLIQFFRGIPKELDEAARIDGCSTFGVLVHILLPLCKPAIISVALFQFIWTWNDFFNPLIFINSVSKYPLQLALRMTIDAQATTNWNQIMAMALVSIIPCIILFFSAQKYFVEGISTTGLKG